MPKSLPHYPDDGEVVALAGLHGYGFVSELARTVGVNPSTARRYLRRRPALEATARAAAGLADQHRKAAAASARTARSRSAERREDRRAWRRKNPDKVAEYRRRWRHSRTRDCDTREYVEIVRQDPCAYCGTTSGCVDHIDAEARGGADSWENMTAACRVCNGSKKADPLLLFMRRRFAEVQ